LGVISNVITSFDAVVVVIDSAAQQKMALKKDKFVTKLANYRDCPVVAFVSASQAPNDFEGCKVFAPKNESNLLAHIRQLHRKTVSEIMAVFSTFDKDANGFIDSKELADACGSMGAKMDDMQIKAMIKELDYSGDGEISPEEFAAWWLTGRKGSTAGRLTKIVAH